MVAGFFLLWWVVAQPFSPGHTVKLTLDAPRGGFQKGEQIVDFEPAPAAGAGQGTDDGQHASDVFEFSAADFVSTIRGGVPARPLSHELLVQETLLRVVAAGAPSTHQPAAAKL